VKTPNYPSAPQIRINHTSTKKAEPLPGSAYTETPMNKDNTFPDSFRGKSGRFYVQCPEGWATMPRYAVYGSVADYDNRSQIPQYLPADEALSDFDKVVRIYPENLKTTPPDASPWERETPTDEYRPARAFWQKRLTKPRQRHAA
jgi:hypothetical protein